MAVVRLSTPAPSRTHYALRQRLEAAIERAVAILDNLDGDPDSEPSLSAGVPRPWTDQRDWIEGATDDREEACEDEGAVTGDNEPDMDADCSWPESGDGPQTAH